MKPESGSTKSFSRGQGVDRCGASQPKRSFKWAAAGDNLPDVAPTDAIETPGRFERSLRPPIAGKCTYRVLNFVAHPERLPKIMHEIVPQFAEVGVPGYIPLLLLTAFFVIVAVTLWASE
jgi:hypothetical protein